LAAALQHQRSHQHAPKDTPGATPFVGTAGAGAYGYPPVAAPASAPSLSINGGRILVVLGAPLKADLCTPDVWLESRLKQTVSVFYRIQTGLSALILSGGRNSGQEVSVSKVMERWLRPFGIRTNSSRFALLNEDMSSCTSAETYPRDLVSQAFCVRSLLRVRGFRHGNLHVLCSDFQLASVATVFNRVFRSSTGLVSLEYIGSPTIRAYAPSADVEAARLKELPSIIKELRTAYASAPLYPYGRCSLLEASRAGSLQSLRLMVEGLGIGGSGFTGFGGGEALINSERDNLGCTSLHIAAECGFTDCCAYLLSHGADPNARSTLGATPLHYATAMNRLDVVELLLDYGAGPSRSVKGGCGRGVWLGSRRPADMHKFGVSPLSPIASSTHMLQESQPSTSVITLLVQPEAVSLADATEELRREHEREAQRKRRAMAAMHRSASNNTMKRSHSRQNSFDRATAPVSSSNAVLSADSGEFSVSLQAMGTSPPVSAPTSPHAKQPDGPALVEATTSGDRAVVLEHGLSPSEMKRLSSGPVSNGLLSVYPSLAGKRVYLLRHSESLWNVNGSHRVRGLIDTTLTNTGVKQAKQLQGLLQRTGALQRLGIRLIAVSPLTRTLQTYMLVARWYLDLFPLAPSMAASALPAAAAAGGGHSTASYLQQLAPPGPCAPPTSPTPSPGSSPCPVRVCVHPDLAEQLLSTGTIGRAPEQLAKDFSDPSLDFSALPPVWWYAPSKDELISESGGSAGVSSSDEPTLPIPAANTKIYLKKEPVARLRRRIHSFLRWLEQQPETSILVVGHGTWFRQMVSLSDERELPDVFQRNLCMYVL
jgi:broad specificity phosphatase PhoE